MQVIGRNEEGNALHESETVVRWQLLVRWYRGGGSRNIQM